MTKQRRVVCAACWHEEMGWLVLGARHWDLGMHGQATQSNIHHDLRHYFVQGFIDQFGVFMDRQEAWKVAEAAGQIMYRVGGDESNGGTLYSENLY